MWRKKPRMRSSGMFKRSADRSLLIFNGIETHFIYGRDVEPTPGPAPVDPSTAPPGGGARSLPGKRLAGG